MKRISLRYLILYMILAVLCLLILYQTEIITFRVTSQNPGKDSYTLRGFLDSKFPSLPVIPHFEKREILGVGDALNNMIALAAFTITMLVLCPVGILYILYHEVAVNTFPDNFIQYKLWILAFLLFVIASPLLFWIYLFLQNCTFMYAATWILFPFLVWAVYRLMKHTKARPAEHPDPTGT
jgi:hypothetical protein